MLGPCQTTRYDPSTHCIVANQYSNLWLVPVWVGGKNQRPPDARHLVAEGARPSRYADSATQRGRAKPGCLWGTVRSVQSRLWWCFCFGCFRPARACFHGWLLSNNGFLVLVNLPPGRKSRRGVSSIRRIRRHSQARNVLSMEDYITYLVSITTRVQITANF